MSVLRLLMCGAIVAALAGDSSGQESRAPEDVAALLPAELDDEDWRAIRKGEIWTALVEADDSRMKRGLAVALVERAASRVFRVVTDNSRFAEFMPRIHESTVEENDDGTVVNYQHLDLPLGTDRKYKVAIRNTTRRDGNLEVHRSSWTHVKGFGNIEDSRGSWTVFDLEPGSSLVVYEVLTDPGGSIPRFLKNFATRRALPDLLESVRRRSESDVYDDVP